MSELSQSKNKFLAPLLFILWLALNLLMLFFHEPWRDELETWSIARNSHSISELFKNSTYEGHPKLWFLILYFVSRFSDSITLVKIVHLLITGAGVFVFLKKFPFKFWISTLIVFGYFLSYEYSIIFRNYGISISFLFLFCARLEKKNHILLSLVAFLILQTNAYASLVGISLWLIYFLKYVKTDGKKLVFPVLIFLSGFICSVLSSVPPPDSGVAEGWFQSWDYAFRGLSAVWDAFVPIPEFQIHSWNSNFVNGAFHYKLVPYIKNTGSLIILFFCLYQLRNSKKAALFFFLSTLLLLLFISFKYHGSLRHHGYFPLSFFIALWLSKIYPSATETSVLLYNSRQKIMNLCSQLFLPTVLLLQLFGCTFSYYYDFKYPFSNSKEVATFISQNYGDKPKIIGDLDYTTLAVAEYLNAEIYSLNAQRKATFIVWDDKRDWQPEDSLVARYLRIKKGSENCILITMQEFKDTTALKLIKRFGPAIVDDEEYFIYR